MYLTIIALCAWCVISPVDKDGRPLARMSWSKNRGKGRERES